MLNFGTRILYFVLLASSIFILTGAPRGTDLCKGETVKDRFSFKSLFEILSVVIESR